MVDQKNSECDVPGVWYVCIHSVNLKWDIVFFFSARADGMFLYQGMVVLAANQVWWTWEVENVFQRLQDGEMHALRDYAAQMHQQIDELVTRITQPMKKNDRRKLNTALILDVHARDIVDKLVLNR